jgi:hypothetical protein
VQKDILKTIKGERARADQVFDEGTNEQANPAVQAGKVLVFVVDTLDQTTSKYGTGAGGRVMKRNFPRLNSVEVQE